MPDYSVQRSMKMPLLLLLLGLLCASRAGQAQPIPTNGIGNAQALRIASQLRAGMSEEAVAKITEEKHQLKLGLRIGGGGQWSRYYLLSNECGLDLRFEPERMKSDGAWEGSLLRSASILSNGVVLVPIVLTNALQPGAAANRSQPVRSETNQTSSVAGSRR
jgi:hypothetical protein